MADNYSKLSQSAQRLVTADHHRDKISEKRWSAHSSVNNDPLVKRNSFTVSRDS